MWMEADPEEAGYLYVDGHVRVYTGDEANLPRRYVSRQRLCLRGATDYWVNDAIGRPFFVVSKAAADGLADCLLKDIAPDLLARVPGQPAEEELEHDPLLHRFVIVFDREGATHSLLAGLWKHRIGAITYRKNVKDVWPDRRQPASKPDMMSRWVACWPRCQRSAPTGCSAVWTGICGCRKDSTAPCISS